MTSMSQMWFEPTIPVFEGAKTVHALDRAAAVCLLRLQMHVHKWTFQAEYEMTNATTEQVLKT
jgi:hypothetical protein